MIYISPYEKRKLVLGDLAIARSPSCVFLYRKISGYFPSSDISFLSYLDLKDFGKQGRRYNLFFLDPEVLKSLGHEYLRLLKKFSKGKNLDSFSLVSRSMSVSEVINFLRGTGLGRFVKDRRIMVDLMGFPRVLGVMSDDKFSDLVFLLRMLMDKEQKRVVVVATKGNLEYLEKRLSELGIRVRSYPYHADERIKRKVLLSFRLKGYEVLLVPRGFFGVYRGYLEPGVIVYFSPPITFHDFLRDLSNFSSDDGFGGEVFVLLSDRDERVISKILKRRDDLSNACLAFVNFLFSKDKFRAIRDYFLDGYSVAKFLYGFSVEFLVNDSFYSFEESFEDVGGNDFRFVEYLRGRWWEMKDIVKLLFGMDESMMFYKGFGCMRGQNIGKVKNLIYSALNKGILNVRFFVRDGFLVKRFF